jgi:multimeric flavodoxin WrbA
MKIVGINGSPRKKGTYFLLEKVLEGAQSEGADTEIINLVEYKILPCQGCDNCVQEKSCIHISDDDMEKVMQKIIPARGIIVGSPSYFDNVSGLLKIFIDRTRPYKMKGHMLQDKVVSALSTSGLIHGGGINVIEAVYHWGLIHGMIVLAPLGNPVEDPSFTVGTVQIEGGFRSIKKDEKAKKQAFALGQRVAKIAKKINEREV